MGTPGWGRRGEHCSPCLGEPQGSADDLNPSWDPTRNMDGPVTLLAA